MPNKQHESHHQAQDHHEGADHSQHHGNFKALFLKSLPLAIPILLFSPLMGIKLPFQFSFPYSDLLSALLATLLLLYGGRPFYQGAVKEFKEKTPGMMALVSMGLSVSYLYSIYAVVASYLSDQSVMDFFFEFASLVLIMLLGHWIEMKAVGEAGDAEKSLARLLPKDVHLLTEDGSIQIRPLADLKVGDVVRVQAGEKIPADGLVLKGESGVNESLLTGESRPVPKKPDDPVIGGSTNGEGVLYVRVEERGQASFLAQVQALLSQAQKQPSRSEDLANKVAGWLFYLALIAALAAFVIWFIISDLEKAILYSVTTLVIACPHALGLAIPLVVARSSSLGASRGLLVKDREALESANRADVMVLDKTGTLTTGEFKVLDLEVFSQAYSKEAVTALMAGMEGGSSHPIAQSILHYASLEGIAALSFDSIEVMAGIGVQGQIDGKTYGLISQKAYGRALDYDIPPGASLSVLVQGGQAIAAIALGDELKASSPGLIKTLKARGMEVIMATGDNDEAARAVAQSLGIDYRANQSPQDKYDLVQALKEQDKRVIMVGDGVNDAPSLALADLGLAVGAGTQVALDSADIILTQSDPGDIESFLELSRRTSRKMKENLLWGAGYNFIAIPLAAGILAPLGISLTPAIGAILMSLSTLIVAVNAILLKLD